MEALVSGDFIASIFNFLVIYKLGPRVYSFFVVELMTRDLCPFAYGDLA